MLHGKAFGIYSDLCVIFTDRFGLDRYIFFVSLAYLIVLVHFLCISGVEEIGWEVET